MKSKSVPQAPQDPTAPTGFIPPAVDKCPICGGLVTAQTRNEKSERWCYSRHHWRRDIYGKAVLLDDTGQDLLDRGLETIVTE